MRKAIGQVLAIVVLVFAPRIWEAIILSNPKGIGTIYGVAFGLSCVAMVFALLEDVFDAR